MCEDILISCDDLLFVLGFFPIYHTIGIEYFGGFSFKLALSNHS